MDIKYYSIHCHFVTQKGQEMTASHANDRTDTEGEPSKRSETDLRTPLRRMRKEQWPENRLTYRLIQKLGLHGNDRVGDLFWHGKKWFKSATRTWLTEDERTRIIQTIEALVTSFKPNDPTALLVKDAEQYRANERHGGGFKPMERCTHERRSMQRDRPEINPYFFD